MKEKLPSPSEVDKLLSEIEKARLHLELILENAQAVSYAQLKQQVGILNKAAQKGKFIKFESRGKIKAIMIPIQKIEQLRKLEQILGVLNLLEGGCNVPEFLNSIKDEAVE